MMILTVTDEKISSEDGAVWLCLKVTDPAAARRFCMAQDKPGHPTTMQRSENAMTENLQNRLRA